MSLNKKLILVSLLYFAEGFPFGLIEKTFTAYFADYRWELGPLGLLALIGMPYALKFFWAPAVDFLGTRRKWITSVQILMAACLVVFIFLDPGNPGILLWTCLGLFATLSATQDIAIDVYSIELLKSSEMGIANGFRYAAYRVALAISGSLFIALGGWLGWTIVLVVAAGVLIVCAVASLRLPSVEVQRPKLSPSSLVAPVKNLLQRPGVFQVGPFILLYKLGDLSMAPMVLPFWKASGLTNTEIGLITGAIGIVASIVGSLAGGLFMARFGIFHGLWFLGLWQAVSNLGYAWVAANPSTGNMGIYLASAVESFCGGLGTSAFLAFLMSVCEKRFSATQYALLSALFRVTGILAGAPSGWVTQYMGFANYFALTFVLSLPALVLVRYARAWIPLNNGAANSHAKKPQNALEPPRHKARSNLVLREEVKSDYVGPSACA